MLVEHCRSGGCVGLSGQSQWTSCEGVSWPQRRVETTAGAMPFKVLEEKEVPRRTPAPGSWEGAQRGRWELDDGRRR